MQAVSAPYFTGETHIPLKSSIIIIIELRILIGQLRIAVMDFDKYGFGDTKGSPKINRRIMIDTSSLNA